MSKDDPVITALTPLGVEVLNRMTPDDIKFHNAVLRHLGGPMPAAAERAADGASRHTADKMHRLRHVPMRYYLPAATDAEQLNRDKALAVLHDELARRGYIALDHDGEPAVLSGRPPVLPHEEKPCPPAESCSPPSGPHFVAAPPQGLPPPSPPG